MKLIAYFFLIPFIALSGQFAMDFDEDFSGTSQVPQGFVITFLTGTKPSTIELHTSYAGPAVNSAALYDSGDGVWKSYTSRSIPVVGNYVAFKGDWRTSAGTYNSMFRATFLSAAYTARMSGQLTQKPSANAFAYNGTFQDCTAITEIMDNPIPLLTGAPADDMFCATFFGLDKVKSLPPDFLNTSGLTGAPAARMCYATCFNMASVNNLPSGFLDFSGLTGTPAASMCYATCYNMASVTTKLDVVVGSGVTFNSTNVSTAASMFYNMNKWGGRVLWGTNVLALAIPVPTTDLNTFYNCTSMPDYTDINANWK